MMVKMLQRLHCSIRSDLFADLNTFLKLNKHKTQLHCSILFANLNNHFQHQREKRENIFVCVLTRQMCVAPHRGRLTRSCENSEK